MPLWRWLCCAVALGAAFGTGPLAVAQEAAAPPSLSVLVVDPSGARIPHAQIYVQGVDIDREASSDAAGSYTLTLVPGTYQITVRADGFRPLSRDTDLAPGDHKDLRMRLSIDVAPEEISVDPTAGNNATPGSLDLSGDQLDVLSDDPQTLRQQLIALAGGGAGILAPQIYVDGFSNGQLPPKSAIRSIHINSNPFSVLYDRPGFGRIEIETRAGGNQLHGMFDAGGTDDVLNSRNPFTPSQPPYHQLLFHGSLSGPVGKKSTFLLAGTSNDLQNNAVVNAVDPLAPTTTLSQAVPDPQRDDDYSLRFDRSVSAANQMDGRYEFHRNHLLNGGVGLLVLPSEGYTSNALTQTLQLDDTQTLNPRLVNDVRFEYVRTRLDQSPNSTAPTVIVEGSFASGGAPTQALHDNQDQYELDDNLSIERGRHFIRAGLRYRLFRDSQNSLAGYNGQYIFPDVASYLAGAPTQFNLTAGLSGTAVTTGDLSLYAEDEFKLTPTFTLKYGLRYESQSGVPDHNDPAPRAGFSWVVKPKAAKLPWFALTGGAGLFYQRLTAANLIIPAALNGVHQTAFYVQNPSFYPAVPPASSLTASEPTIYLYQPSFHTSETFLSSLTVQRAIGRIGSVSASYIDAEGRHQYLSTNANAPLPGTYNPAVPGSGVRPLGVKENLYQYTSEGTGRDSLFTVNANLMPSRLYSLFVFYVAQSDRSDSNGINAFASNSYNIRQDYGNDDADTQQQIYLGGSVNLPYGISIRPFVSARGGKPFNITTGSDLNGDTLYNDRPAFATDLSRASVVHTAYGTFDTDPLPTQQLIPYNYARGPALFWTDLQVSETLHLGPRPAMKSAPAAAPQKATGPQPAAPPPQRPWTLSFSLEAENLFNNTNASNPVGVLSSPLFGKSLSIATDFSPLTAANRTLLLHSTFTF